MCFEWLDGSIINRQLIVQFIVQSTIYVLISRCKWSWNIWSHEHLILEALQIRIYMNRRWHWNIVPNFLKFLQLNSLYFCVNVKQLYVCVKSAFDSSDTLLRITIKLYILTFIHLFNFHYPQANACFYTLYISTTTYHATDCGTLNFYD